LVLSAIGPLVPSAAQSRGDGVITGQVVDAAGKPVGAAIVEIHGAQPVNQPRILTAGDGRFAFRGLLTPATVSIIVTKMGYAPGAIGRRRPGGTPQDLELNDARKTADVVVRVWKYGTIAGTLTDEAGEPVVGVLVRALARTSVGGRKRVAPAGSQVYTDDRGVYRIGSLGPGEYLVMASPPVVSMRASMFADIARTGRGAGVMPMIANGATAMLTVGDALVAIPRGAAVPPPPIGGRLQIYPTTFHPSALGPGQATAVTLGSGEERTNVDIQLRPMPAARVSGMLVSPAGPVAMGRVDLVTPAIGQVPSEIQLTTALTDASGAFTFAAVTPGQYKLMATSGGPTQGDAFFADVPVAVAGDDIDNLTVMMNPALKVSGRLQFDGSSPKPDGARGRFVPFALEAVDAQMPGAPVGRGGTITEQGFTVNGFQPGQYLVRITNSPQGWMFKSAMLDGVDVSETPFELTSRTGEIVVTFTDRWSGMSGTVQGAGSDAAAVIVFPTDAQRWDTPASNPRRLRLVRTNTKGAFGVSSLPPGDYFVVAVADDDSGDWRDGARLDALSRAATQVTILDGEHKTLNLQLREVRR
jgi:hypothetical protein